MVERLLRFARNERHNGINQRFLNLKKSFQPRKHTEDTETQYIPGATIHHLAGDGGRREAYDLVRVFPCDSVANAVYRFNAPPQLAPCPAVQP